MPLIPFGDYRPDVSDYEGRATRNIRNVIPRGDGYGPFPGLSIYTSALPSACRGAFYALKSDGTVITFAGTANKLYRLNNTDFSWVDVSFGAATYGVLSSNAQWQFAQTGNFVFATQANSTLQVFDLSSSSTFNNALGTPPQAAYISVVGKFLVLSGLLSSPYRIQWSGLNNFNATDSWTSGIKSSDFQDFPDGGIVRGVAGGDSGVADHLSDRPDHPGQGALRAVFDHSGRGADIFLCRPGLSQDRTRRGARADRPGESRSHVPR
jgi:hypothetical protein